MDPFARKRGKQGLIEDGPITVANGSVDPTAIRISDIIVGSDSKSDNKDFYVDRNPSSNNHSIQPKSATTSNVIQTQTIQV